MNGSKSIVIIPTYNESLTIEGLIVDLSSLHVNLHILIIDDGSPDGTANICKRLAVQNPIGNISVIENSSKNGLGAAYRQGFEYAVSKYDYIFQMDADRSHEVADLMSIYKTITGESNVGLALGSRWIEGGNVKDWSLFRIYLSRFANRFASSALMTDLSDSTSGLRGYRASALSMIPFSATESNGYCFQIEMTKLMLETNFDIVEVPISFTERKLGSSKMDSKIVWEALNIVAKWWLLNRKKMFLNKWG